MKFKILSKLQAIYPQKFILSGTIGYNLANSFVFKIKGDDYSEIVVKNLTGVHNKLDNVDGDSCNLVICGINEKHKFWKDLEVVEQIPENLRKIYKLNVWNHKKYTLNEVVITEKFKFFSIFVEKNAVHCEIIIEVR